MRTGCAGSELKLSVYPSATKSRLALLGNYKFSERVRISRGSLLTTTYSRVGAILPLRMGASPKAGQRQTALRTGTRSSSRACELCNDEFLSNGSKRR